MALDGVVADALFWTIKVAQYCTSAVFLLFLSHKLLMLLVYPYVTRKEPVAGVLPQPRPFVSVQLPCFNESAVIRRVIDSACGMDWPKDRFEVHVLDDSNDETVCGDNQPPCGSGRPMAWASGRAMGGRERRGCDWVLTGLDCRLAATLLSLASCCLLLAPFGPLFDRSSFPSSDGHCPRCSSLLAVHGGRVPGNPPAHAYRLQGRRPAVGH